MRDFCSNYKEWFSWCNYEHYYCKYVFFINKQKGKKECTGKHADFSINMLQTKCDFSHHSVNHIFHCFNLKGGMLPANDSCHFPFALMKGFHS